MNEMSIGRDYDRINQMTKSEKLSVHAYIPPLQSAIMVDGAGDVLQVKLAISLKESPDGLLIQTLTQKQLLVTFQELKPQKVKPIENGKSKKRERYPYRT
jgi:hypothetical protein